MRSDLIQKQLNEKPVSVKELNGGFIKRVSLDVNSQGKFLTFRSNISFEYPSTISKWVEVIEYSSRNRIKGKSSSFLAFCKKYSLELEIPESLTSISLDVKICRKNTEDLYRQFCADFYGEPS